MIGQHLEFRPVAEEPFVLLAPHDCVLDDAREILATFPFIRISRSLWSGQLIDNWLVQERIFVREAMELDGIQMISTMVYHNIGVSIVPKRCVAAPNPVRVREVPLGPSLEPRTVGLLSPRDNPKPALIDALYNQLKAVIKDQAPEPGRGPPESHNLPG